MALSNKETLVQKLTDIADGFRTSRSLTSKLSLDEMATLAAVPIGGGGENKLSQLVDGTLTEITAEELEGATKIREYAFYEIRDLTTITLPNTITEINKYAFYRTGITSIVIPNSVNLTAADYCFDTCQSLTSVVLPENPNSLQIPSYFFHYCSQLNNVVVPDNNTILSGYAFKGCSRLSNITLSNNLKTIATECFRNCGALKDLTIPSSVQTISTRALTNGTNADGYRATITFLRTTPPSIQSNTFAVGNLEKIIVPAGSGEAYRTATNWANFADYIEEAAV